MVFQNVGLAEGGMTKSFSQRKISISWCPKLEGFENQCATAKLFFQSHWTLFLEKIETWLSKFLLFYPNSQNFLCENYLEKLNIHKVTFMSAKNRFSCRMMILGCAYESLQLNTLNEVPHDIINPILTNVALKTSKSTQTVENSLVIAKKRDFQFFARKLY